MGQEVMTLDKIHASGLRTPVRATPRASSGSDGVFYSHLQSHVSKSTSMALGVAYKVAFFRSELGGKARSVQERTMQGEGSKGRGEGETARSRAWLARGGSSRETSGAELLEEVSRVVHGRSTAGRGRSSRCGRDGGASGVAGGWVDSAVDRCATGGRGLAAENAMGEGGN